MKKRIRVKNKKQQSKKVKKIQLTMKMMIWDLKVEAVTQLKEK